VVLWKRFSRGENNPIDSLSRPNFERVREKILVLLMKGVSLSRRAGNDVCCEREFHYSFFNQ